LSEIEESHKRIVMKGAKLIRDGMNIYSHCHSSTVIDILKFAKKIQKKNLSFTQQKLSRYYREEKPQKNLRNLE
jgi:translation initiation factor 2B subunit (eIF-2B alpha/beta/delta family)